jgi:hypothetical protein
MPKPSEDFEEVMRGMGKKPKEVKFPIYKVKWDWDIALVKAIKKLFKRKKPDDGEPPLGYC